MAGRIFASTQGNPLFLEEMARLLIEAGGRRGSRRGGARAGVRAVIRQRLERVSDAARPLLELAAVAGDDIRPGAAGGGQRLQHRGW